MGAHIAGATARRRRTVVGAYRRRVKVGELTAASRAALDRVHARWSALKRDVAGHVPESDAWRASFMDTFARWGVFYQAAITDWAVMGPANTSEAAAFDRELDTWRTEYPAHSGGRPPSSGLTSTTGDREPDPLGLRAAGEGIGRGVRNVALAAAVVAVAWGLSSVAKIKG